MARGKEIVRLLKILRNLEAGRTNTIPKLAIELECTERTVRRDLDALQRAGFPSTTRRSMGPPSGALHQGSQGARARH
jgi:predicted DNA-binding transcriptional regulator YafY